VNTGFWWENLREGDNSEGSDADGRIILKSILERWYRGMDWIDLAQDRDIEGLL
jgi:hypothetical protein